MAEFSDRIQGFMDEFYHEWQKDENRGKDKWEILGGFSEAHQIAVMFGNFNYQVENGGIEQWIYNGYFHDDAEKFTEYLDTYAESDERLQTILDRVYTLERYARETGCDRNGNYIEPGDDDGESGFLGDLINCNAFDTWYYGHCGGEDWWKTVCGIIDEALGREIATVRQDVPVQEILAQDNPAQDVLAQDNPAQDERGCETASRPPLRVFIENARDARIGGFAMPFPATPEAIRSFFEDAEIRDWRDVRISEVRANVKGLGEMLTAMLSDHPSPNALNELNYLAAKIDGLDEDARSALAAAVEARRHCGSVAGIINLTGNTSCFEIQPAFNAEQYGEFLLEDEAKYASFYFGPEDIPAEYRLNKIVEQPLVTADTDLTAFVLKAHALGGDFMADASRNLNILEDRRSAEYLMLVTDNTVDLTAARDAYREGTDAHATFTGAAENPGTRLFALHVTDMHRAHVAGNVVALDAAALRDDIQRHSIRFTHVTARDDQGKEHHFTPEQWSSMELIDRDRLHTWTRHFDPADHGAVRQHLEDVRDTYAATGKHVDAVELLAELNREYMSRAGNPQPDMLRVTLPAAREMLANGDAPVYRLMLNGSSELSPLDAMPSRGGLQYLQNREFAIYRHGMDGLDKWAAREAVVITAERGKELSVPDKSRANEPEL